MEIVFRKQKNLQEFSDFTWLVQARAKEREIPRYDLTLIKSMDGFVFATDGHRLHALVYDDLWPGMYRVSAVDESWVVLQPAPDAKYPDCIGIWGERHASVWTGRSYLYDGNGGPLENLLYRLVRHMPDRNGPRIEFMADVVRTETEVFWTAHITPDGKIHMESERRFAAIMPADLYR